MNPRPTEVFAGALLAVLLHLAVLFWPEALFPARARDEANPLATVVLQSAPDPEPPEREAAEAEESEAAPEPESTPPEPTPAEEPPPPEPEQPEQVEPPAAETPTSEPEPAAAEPPVTPPADTVEMKFREEDPAARGTVEGDPDGELRAAIELRWDDYDHVQRVARRLRFKVGGYRMVDGRPQPVVWLRCDPRAPMYLEREPYSGVPYANVAFILDGKYFREILARSSAEFVLFQVRPSTYREWNEVIEREAPGAERVVASLRDEGGRIRLDILR